MAESLPILLVPGLNCSLRLYAGQMPAHRVDSRPLLASIRVPTLVLVGEQDAATPPDLSDEMAAAIPGARLARIAVCGHLSTMSDP